MKNVSINRLLTETDAPFLSPFVGKRNEPAFIIEAVKKIAEIKGFTTEFSECPNSFDSFRSYIRDMLNEAESKYPGIKRGVIHSFVGTKEQLQEYLKMGFYIGFTGLVTFKSQAEEVQSIVKELPLDKILIETDAPFLSPEPYRGQRNEPAYVKLVAQKVAELKNLPISEVSDATFNNAKNLFKF